MPADSLAFARSARALASEARRRGLTAPAFRSPPGLAGADRTLRRQPGGGAVVAVKGALGPSVGDHRDGGL